MAQGRNAALIGSIAASIINGLTQANADPRTPMSIPPQDIPAVAERVLREVEKSPEVKHITSTETSPWQSRAHWAMVVSIVAPVLGLVGINLAPEHMEAIAQIGWVAASAVTAYLAYRARTATKPLGE